MQFNDLKGKTLVNVEVEGDIVKYRTDKGEKFISYHEQDCCESVWVEDVCGDVADLLNNPLLNAEEVTDEYTDGYGEHTTYTFYKLDTVKGGVTIRWCGTSNGYYSEEVSFKQVVEGYSL